MTCANPEIGAMITRYEFGLLNEEERKLFEEHLLFCDACFADFYEFAPVAQAMKTQPQECLEALAEPMGFGERIKQFLQAVLDDLRKFFAPLSVRIPAFTLATAAAAAFLLFLFAPQWQYTHLAQGASYKQLSSSLRSYSQRAPSSIPSADSVFQEAIFHYKYQQDTTIVDPAIVAMLRDAIARAPAHAGANFFLGVFLFQQGEADSALAHLKQAGALENPDWEQARHWFLGNAYLKKNEADSAQAELRLVAAAAGSYSQAANDLLEKIRQIQERHWWDKYFQKSPLP